MRMLRAEVDEVLASKLCVPGGLTPHSTSRCATRAVLAGILPRQSALSTGASTTAALTSTCMATITWRARGGVKMRISPRVVTPTGNATSFHRT
jgi:hypothetical protein